jgi:tetratricopeptide (TPR) repeat protein
MSKPQADVIQSLQHVLNSGSLEERISAIEALETRKPREYSLSLLSAHLNLLSENYSKTIKGYRKAIKFGGNRDPQLWYGIGLLYLKFNQHCLAEQAFHTLLALDQEFPHRVEIYEKLTSIYLSRGDWPNAIVWLEKVSQASDYVPKRALVKFMQSHGNALESTG